MSYALENALFQWDEGERRLRDSEPRERAALDRAVFAVLDELRRRLGSSFTIAELADLYATDPDWAHAIAQRHAVTTESSSAVDAAFGRYAREASDFAGGRTREAPERPRDR